MSYLNRLSQNVTADALNTSSANLSAGSWFVGKATSTLGVASIQVGLKTTQNATVIIEQSGGLTTGTGTVTTNGSITLTGSGTNFLSRRIGDEIFVSGETVRVIASIASDVSLTVTVAFSTSSGSLTYQWYDWDLSDSYNYIKSIDNFGIPVSAILSYERVRVQNLGIIATTAFRLSTVLCPISDTLPRSLDQDGCLVTCIRGIQDGYGWETENTPTGETRTSTVNRLVGAQFEGSTVDTNFWQSTVANSATITQANAEATLTSGTNAAASAKITSMRRARYVSGSANRYRAVVQLADTGTASNTRSWGMAWGSGLPATPTITDGAYFQITGTTFSVVILKGGSPNVISSGSFNGVLGDSYSPTVAAATYEIYYTNSKVYFVIGSDILHTVSASASPWANTMGMFIYMDNINSGNTTSVTLKCRGALISRLGQMNTLPTSKYQSGTVAALQCKLTYGNLHQIIISTVTSGSVITLWDNTAASGTVIWSATMTFGNQNGGVIYTIPFGGLPFHVGLTLTIATQPATVTLIYE